MMKSDRHVTAMEMGQESAPEGASQAKWDGRQMADWVNWLAPWQVIAHLTWKDWLDDHGFPHGITVEGARKSFEKFMRRELPRLSYFYAIEPNPSREGSHVHALWADCGSVLTTRRRSGDLVRAVAGPEGAVDVWQSWFNRYGRAKIELVRSHDDVTRYCAKHLASSYTTKGAVWWNVKLQWHRVQAMHNSDYQLRQSSCPGERCSEGA
jgi:hypothetical protein